MMQNQQPTSTYPNNDLPPPPPYSSVNPDVPLDSESQLESSAFKSGFSSSFSDASIRRAFVRKVYGVLVCQLTVTTLFITLFLFVRPLREYSYENQWLWIVSFRHLADGLRHLRNVLSQDCTLLCSVFQACMATLMCIFVLSCCPDVRRTYPANVVVLAIFTLCESFLLGSIASCYEAEAVLIAVGITAVVVVALTAFAMQTKWDFTMCSGSLLVLLVILICMGFLCIFVRNEVLSIVYASLGALVFSLVHHRTRRWHVTLFASMALLNLLMNINEYLVFDTQMILGGKHKYALSPEEYIFAALNLYLDIINLLLFVLQIVGRARSS